MDLAAYGWTPVNKALGFNTAQSGTVLWTPGSGKQIVLLGALFSTDVEMYMHLRTAGTYVVSPCYLAANGGAVISGGGPIWKGAVDATLNFTSSAAGDHSVLLWGYEE